MVRKRTVPGKFRGRVDLRVDPELRQRIEVASKATFGAANISVYIRAAILRALEEDERRITQAGKVRES